MTCVKTSTRGDALARLLVSALAVLGAACDGSSAAPTSDTSAGDASPPPDGSAPVSGTFSCETHEEIAAHTVVRDAVLTLDGQTLRFPTLPACAPRTLGANTRYTEIVFAAWVDETRLVEEYALGSGYVSAIFLTGASDLGPGTFQIVQQPTTAEGFDEVGVYGMLGIKEAPLESATAIPWALTSGTVEVFEHGTEDGDLRCLELKLHDVTVTREGSASTKTLAGSIGCRLP